MRHKSFLYLALFQMLLMATLVFGSFQQAKAQSSQSGWAGRYEFFDSQEKFRNRPSDFVTYTLTITLNGNQLKERFQADGTQNNDEFECSIEASASQIKVYFHKDLNGNNANMFKPLKKGQLLFTLTKVKIGAKTKFHFVKAAYENYPLSSIKPTKIYFAKKVNIFIFAFV